MEKFSVKISPMKKEDLDGILVVEEASYGEHHWSKDSFYSELTNNLAKYFCAFDENNNLLGYAGSWLVIDEGHVTTIAVDPKHRGKKIGEALLTTIFDTCYKNMVKYLTLEVRVSNTPAINLYEKYNFKSLGTRKGYYQNNNEDALIMWTENIFWDKFKEKYNENVAKLKEQITIL
ncbi:ribosomal protein S18-alanine N-acetyltransferase [bacterium]|nr:ribosomal protein S18-alanine N-acetyltransferase [bacterium]